VSGLKPLDGAVAEINRLQSQIDRLPVDQAIAYANVITNLAIADGLHRIASALERK
jgi:hypothetical protein